MLISGSDYACNTLEQLTSNGIVAHLNCAPELSNKLKGRDENAKPLLMHLNIHYIVAHSLDQFDSFVKGAKFIEEAKKENGKVLVNCARGRSRSVAVVLFYFMFCEGKTLRDAYMMVKQARPFAGPSRHLRPQLLACEMKILGKQSFNLKDNWADQVAGAMRESQKKSE